jgi:hypothetical protein
MVYSLGSVEHLADKTKDAREVLVNGFKTKTKTKLVRQT